jgi:hypothetical protein
MPIVRTFGCPECNHVWNAELTAEQWDDPPPSCPECDRRDTQQIFRPVAIGGSPGARANAIAEEIAARDYHVADMQRDHHEGATTKARYNPIDIQGNRIIDNRPVASSAPPSSWVGINAQQMQAAVDSGRHTRLNFGNGLDVLQSALKSGDQPDLIEASKRKSSRIW